MAEPWIRYKPKNEGKLYRSNNEPLPYTEGLDPLIGLGATVDYLTTAPLRGGVSESLKAKGPWNRFKAFGRGALNSFKNPGSSPSSAEVATRAGLSDRPFYERSGRLSFGGLASKLSPADLGGFVGEQVLDPTNLVPMSKAMMLGATATGFKGAKRVFSALWDKKPRFEISDKSLKLKDFGKKPSGEYAKNYNLSDIVDHPELFENYPELKGRLLSFTDNLPKGNAYFTPESESFTMSAKDMDDPETLKKNLLHEIQHWVQRKEGFAKGGSPRDFTEDLRANKRTAESMITEINEKLSNITKRMDFLKQNGFASETKKGTPGYEALLANKKEYEDLLDKRMGLIKNAQIDVSSEAHHQYKRLAGEAEARDTEARRNYPDWLRQKIQPLKSTGLALNDLIVRGVDERSPNIAMSNNQPITNNLGRPVHPTAEGQENFKKWFEGSKVVDEKGQPIVAYHGTPESFDSFNKNSWFTTDPKDASTYSEVEIPGGRFAPNMLPTYIKMKNPKHVSGYILKREAEELLDKSKKYDGIIITKPNGIKHYVVKNPAQIKSATGNSGKFNPKDPNILKGLAPVGPWMLYKRNQEQNQNKKER